MKSRIAGRKSRILAWLRLARLSRWKGQFLDYCSGGNIGAEPKGAESRPAIAFWDGGGASFTEAERRALLQLARESLFYTVNHGTEPSLASLGAKLMETKACFVTLSKAGKLRGCVGHIFPKESLACAIRDNTHNAAFCDPRFNPVAPNELEEIRIEISVLSSMQALCFSSPEELLSQLHPYQDGVLLQLGLRMATFLPQVWNQFLSKTEFLDRLSEKAGCPPGAWRSAEALVSTYRIESFAETLDSALRN
jgi:AmmeMemoRadiSam system protein A